MSKRKVEKLFRGVTGIGDDLIEEAETAPVGKKMSAWRRWRAVAACFAAIILFTVCSLATAFAVNEDFKQTVIAFLFPTYTENQLHEIDEGHRTGAFSMEDTLFTFLERFNTENMEDRLTVKKENGFEFVILPQNENSIYVVAACTTPDAKLLVVMERTKYEETTGLWQVTAYQVLDSEAANEMIANGQ